jgi:hypothetical protein
LGAGALKPLGGGHERFRKIVAINPHKSSNAKISRRAGG